MSTSNSPDSSLTFPNATTLSQQPAGLSDKREELTEFLRSRLIECGWRDQVANMCRNLIHKHGIEQIRLEQIIAEVRPKARLLVPDQIKSDLLETIRKLDQNLLQSQSQPQPQTQPQPHPQEKIKIPKIEEENPNDGDVNSILG